MTELDFLYSQDELRDIADNIIKKALSLGASSAQVEVSESISSDIEVLNQQIENFETSHESQLLLTIFSGQKKGNIGISDISPHNIDQVIRQALDIANYTQEDQANGILEREYLANSFEDTLQLYCPKQIDNQALIREAKYIEEIATNIDPVIKTSDGSSISLSRYNFVTANSNGFNQGYQTTRYSNYISLIGENSSGMQTDYWYSSARDYQRLLKPEQLASVAVSRLARRLTKGDFKEQKPKVIFETNIAKSVIGSLIGALSGNALYRKLSFLNDSLGKQVLPKWLSVQEDPFIRGGLASCYFDNEGGQVSKRNIIEKGIVSGYLLSAYSARRMNMKPTANAGGAHNLIVTSNFEGNLEKLAREMTNGIIIIETIGHGLNSVTGDYSVGASGLAVINGNISHYVDNLTISGNMRDIFNNIQAVANDSSPGSITCGSMLIDSGCLQVSS